MANRRICALDMKTIHLMRSKNGGTRVIDYGGSWCVRRVTALEDWRASIRHNDEGIGALERRVMFAVMVVQLSLFNLFWTENATLFLVDVAWHLARDRDVWKLVRRVFNSEQMKPICTTYYDKHDGGDLVDAYEYSLLHTAIGPDNELISDYTKRPWDIVELRKNIAERHLHRPCF